MDIRLCVLAILVLSGYCHCSDFDCESLMPINTETIEQDKRTFPVTFKVSKYQYSPSDEIQVTFSIHDDVEIVSFISQVRLANLGSIRGTWMVGDGPAKTHACAREADTLINMGNERLRKLTATWVAPHVPSPRGGEQVEVVITVMTADGRYWLTSQPMLMESAKDVKNDEVNPEQEEAAQKEGDPGFVENPNDPQLIAERERQQAEEQDIRGEMEDDHGLRKEIELIKLKQEELANEIADEDRASEGDWSRVLEEERRQAEEAAKREMYEYERTKAEEEEARRERMRQEIRDKEEWEREQARLANQKPPSRPDDGPNVVVKPGQDDIDIKDPEKISDSGNMIAATLVTVFLSFLVIAL